jgi:hypothetical protein
MYSTTIKIQFFTTWGTFNPGIIWFYRRKIWAVSYWSVSKKFLKILKLIRFIEIIQIEYKKKKTRMNVEGWRGRGRPKTDGLTVWGRIWERWLWVMKWRVIKENVRTGPVALTPNELGKGQVKEEVSTQVIDT